MPCPNCLCASCAKERAKPDGWIGDQLWSNGANVATVACLPMGSWSWLNDAYICGPYETREAAMKAAEEAYK